MGKKRKKSKKTEEKPEIKTENDKERKVSDLTAKPMDELKDDWLANVRTFSEILSDPDKVREVSELTEKDYPKMHEYQKKLTSMVLRAFPGIDRHIRKEDIEFHVRILKIPFYKAPEDLQHDCVQMYLAGKQGAINIATGSQRIFTDKFYVDMPVIAPRGKADALLFEQRSLLDQSMPKIQRECLIEAQPVAMANSVYDYEGRWLVWRLLFDLDKVNRIAMEIHEAAPLYAHKLALFRLSSLFPYAGTTDGELSLIVIEEDEVENFQTSIGEIRDDFGLETTYVDAQISVSWESIVSLGILPYAAEPHIPEIGRIFTEKLKNIIMEDAVADFGSFTEKNNVSEQKSRDERIRGLSERMASDIMHRRLESVFHVTQRISELYMKRYEIRGLISR